jgi:hypothetical protein
LPDNENEDEDFSIVDDNFDIVNVKTIKSSVKLIDMLNNKDYDQLKRVIGYSTN